jgi:hypothetical protein
MYDFESEISACCLFATCVSESLFEFKLVRLKSIACHAWDSGDNPDYIGRNQLRFAAGF